MESSFLQSCKGANYRIPAPSTSTSDYKDLARLFVLRLLYTQSPSPSSALLLSDLVQALGQVTNVVWGDPGDRDTAVLCEVDVVLLDQLLDLLRRDTEEGEPARQREERKRAFTKFVSTSASCKIS